MVEVSAARRRDKQESREALLRAATELFAESGFDGPSLAAICERAGYTRGVFYVHFQSRNELVAAVVEWVLGDFIDQVIAPLEAGEGDLASMATRFVERAIGGLDPGASDAPGGWFGALAFHRVLEAASRAPRVRKTLARLLLGAVDRLEALARADQARGRVRPDAEPREIARILLLLATGLLAVQELELPFDLERSRHAVLALLASPE